jgi:hypothetical protein
MVDTTLRDQLTALRQEYEAGIQDIEHERRVCLSRQDEIRQEIRHLQELLRELGETYSLLESEQSRQAEAYPEKETQIVLEALEKSYANLVQTQEYWLARIDLDSRRRALLERDPELDQVLQDYRAFEATSPASLEALPTSYRASLLEQHRKATRRLAPYLKLEKEDQNLECKQPVAFQLVVAQDPESGEVNWVLPFRDNDDLPSDVNSVLCEVVWAVLDRIIGLSTEDEWAFDDVSVEVWKGFDALLIRGEYIGEKGLVDAAQHLLQAGVASLPLFHGVDVSVLVGEMSQSAWRLGEEVQEPTPEPLKVSPVGISEEVEPLPLGDVTQGWYTEEDVVSWNRPLRVAPDSLWNVQARRLRTMLIRMVARGGIGAALVSETALWENLPSPHKENLAAGVTRLIGEGLLSESESEPKDGRRVGLNPEMLSEVQNLINRDVTPFWAGVIGSEAVES